MNNDETSSSAQISQTDSSHHSTLPQESSASEVISIFGSSAPSLSTGYSSSSAHEVSARDFEQARATQRTSGATNTNYSTRPSMGDQDDAEAVRTMSHARMLPRVEKDVDDPTTPPPLMRPGKARQNTTLGTSLSRLLAAQASVSPEASRPSSYIHSVGRVSTYSRSIPTAEMASLPNHIYDRGFLDGKFSDIIVHAFGQGYKLHRIILDRAPFFRSALSEPWLEASAKETTLHPEDIDPAITKASFELALKRLYGCSGSREEEAESIGLFATACWLEMIDLVDTSVENILRQMNPENLAELFRLVVSNYYGRAGDKIMASAKSMLCRDGWHMPIRYWDGIPGHVIREMVGGDGFFIDGEWDRWNLAKKLLDRRLKAIARDAGLVEQYSSSKVLKVPDAYILEANRFGIRLDTVYRRNAGGSDNGVSPDLLKWASVYTHSDVYPILTLLDEGVHYIHLDFEQLQIIRTAKDALGIPAVSEKVISNALWQQMELRQKILNTSDSELELGISVPCAYDGRRENLESTTDTTMTMLSSQTSSSKNRLLKKPPSARSSSGEEVGSPDSSATRHKFWIPSSDCNIVMGGNADPVVATSDLAGLQSNPEDAQSPSQTDSATLQSPLEVPKTTPQGVPADGDGSVKARYTHFPPFRFAAEFPDPRLMKKRQRVYSRTVFYAGSLWNVYIQKVTSSRNKQLGVYLHRVKEEEAEEVIAGSLGLAQGSVDERIAQLERMMMNVARHDRLEHQQNPRDDQQLTSRVRALEQELRLDYLVSSITGDSTSSGTRSRSDSARTAISSTASRISHLSSRGPASQWSSSHHTPAGTDSDSEDSDSLLNSPASAKDEGNGRSGDQVTRIPQVPTLPPYVDVRPTIKTYFKIYSPSRGGRMLSVYESAPDKFNFSQSWGWKSSTLMLDEGFLGDSSGGDDGVAGGHADEVDNVAVGGEGGAEGVPVERRTSAGRSDGKLRFMVVIGNV